MPLSSMGEKLDSRKSPCLLIETVLFTVLSVDLGSTLERAVGKILMEKPVSKNGILIRITDERWTHVVESHDYMAGNLELVVETIEDPDYIVAGRKGEFIRLYAE